MNYKILIGNYKINKMKEMNKIKMIKIIWLFNIISMINN